MKILVVDDYESAAYVTGHMFEMLGHKVELAYSGKEAIKKAEEFQPNLILLDIGMPEMDGIETCRRLRSNDNFKETRIVAQTGHGDDETIEACIEAGFNEHLLKPVGIKHIQDIIQSMS